MNLSLFRKIIINSLPYFIYFLGLFFINRLLFFIIYGKNIDFEYLDLFSAFLVGIRFDISVICYAFIPLALWWLISIFISQKYSIKFQKNYFNFAKYYLTIALLIFVSFFIIDFFYYQFFQSHINILFFGIFKDDTQAVLYSVWKDYPILKILSILIVLICSFLPLHKNLKKSIALPEKTTKRTLSLLIIFPLLIIGMRGSIGIFPLRREHTNISPNEFINSLCYNPLYALNFAYSELKDNSINPDIDKELETNGWNSIEQVYQNYKKDNQNLFNDEGYASTPHNDFLTQNPPNVVFILMESLSNHYFDIHSKELNLLGDLYDILPDLYYFKNALPSFNGTIYSLENLLINTPKNIIAQSPYFNVPFKSSVAIPFKNRGYETAFITGAYTSWRNIDKFIQNQGFDIIEGSSHILQKFPKSETFAWGTHDGYLFDYIKEHLKKATKPQFIFSLTVSNHTPYEIPSHYKPYPIQLHSIKEKIRVDEKMAYDNFYSHQYSASQLAKFIKEIKNSSLGENTIIIATGDHNIRQIFEYPNEEIFSKYSVPILFYIPEKYKPSFFNPDIFVSHKDIFPTIFNLSLSHQKYIYSGENMFKQSDYRFALNNYNFIVDSIGVISTENTPTYYIWKDKEKRKLKIENISNPHAQFLLQKMKAFSTFQTIQTYKDINNTKK